MIKNLVRNGNSLSLVITKEMVEKLGLDGTEVEVLESSEGLIVRKPRPTLTVSEARDRAFAKYDAVFKELAK